MRKRVMIICCVVILVLFFLSLPGSALVALPQDAGIDYRTMKVTDASKLKAKGMKRVEVGDIVSVGPVENGGLSITNKRTGEKIKWR